MPSETLSFEPQHSYDITQYLEGVAGDDISVLNELAGVVEGEITIGVHKPFADRALDLAHLQPFDLRTMMNRPAPTMDTIKLVLADIKAVQSDPTVPEETSRSPGVLTTMAIERKLAGLRLRHSLGVRTCEVALDIAKRGTIQRVSLVPADKGLGFIQPKQAIWPQIRRQPADSRYKDYVAAHAKARAHDSYENRTKAKNRLLVATAALAVHQAIDNEVN